MFTSGVNYKVQQEMTYANFDATETNEKGGKTMRFTGEVEIPQILRQIAKRKVKWIFYTKKHVSYFMKLSIM